MSYVLPPYTLPPYTLPSRAVALISEYSKPLTRPDWRTLCRLSIHTLYKEVNNMYCDWENVTKRLLLIILNNIKKTEWYFMYHTIRNNGLDSYYVVYFYKYGVNYDRTINVRNIDGMKIAIQYHLNMFKIKRIPNCKKMIGLKKLNF